MLGRLFYRLVWLPALMLLMPAAGSALAAPIRDGGIDPANLGKGEWLYYMSSATNKLGGYVPAVTNENSLMLYLKSQRTRYIIVKAGTSDQLFNGSYPFPQFTSSLVNTAHANGLLIFGYNRSYGSNIVGEIAISDYVFNQGADGFVWDAEAEWESSSSWIGSSGPAKAWQLCSTVRSNWPNKFLGHSPFAIISYHSSFPYKEFGYWSDTVMPQIYHFSTTGLKGSESATINWTDVNWVNWQNSLAGQTTNINGETYYWTNAIKPLVPINDVYGPPYSAPTPDNDVMEFIDCLAADPNSPTAGGYKGANFFRADLHDTTQWSYIKAGTLGGFTGVVSNIVIDDPKAAKFGTWTSVRTFYNATFYGNGSGTDTNSFGTNYLTRPQGTGSSYVQFTPGIVVPGDYNVYQWHPSRAEASASVPFLITYSTGSTTVYANQQTNPGSWSLLGRFNFAAGTAGNVRVTDAIAEPSGIVMVDGLKLVFIPPTSTPTAPTGLNATAISASQINLAWVNAATNQTGFVLARGTVTGGPYSDIGSVAGTVTNYSDSGLLSDTAYYYVVRATNFLGASAVSPEAGATTIGSPIAPSITTPPQPLTVVAGQDAPFTVVAAGSPSPVYQWWFNNSPLQGATTTAYTRASAQLPDAGDYWVVVSNSQGAATSAPAALVVNFSLAVNTAGGGSVSKSPDLANYTPNSSVSVTAAPDAGFAFIGWSGDAGGTANPLTLLLATNTSITANFVSTATELILDNTNAAVSFSGGWTTGTMSPDKYGPDYSFASTAAGGLSDATYRPFLYQPGYYDVFVWYPQGSNRATNAPWSIFYLRGSTLVLVNEQINGGGWFRLGASLPFAQGANGYVRLSNDTGYAGSVVLADAVRFLLAGSFALPSISAQPQGRAAVTGGSASFTVGASSATPARFQWRLNGKDLLGQTNATLAITNVQANDFGTYSVLVSNDGGALLSDPAALTQASQPAILPPVLSQNVFTLSFTTELGPSYVVEYKDHLDEAQWQLFNLLPGTGEPLSVLDDMTNQMRLYRIRVH